MSQDNKKSFVMYQGDGSNNVFSVPMTKGKYGTISVAFVRRGLDQYEYNPDTWGLNGGLFAWDLSGTKVYTDTATPAIGATVYDQYGVDTGDTVTAVGGATITVNTNVYTRDTLHDVDENTVLTWTGDALQIGDYIVIERTTTRTQPFEFQNNQKHIEKSDDNLERQIQEVADKVDNALLVDPTHTIDSNKMNPVEWMQTILRSVDKSVRGFRYLNGWLDYSLDDPNIADVDKTWTHLVNTDNIKAIREQSRIENNETIYYTEYLAQDGSWKTLSDPHKWNNMKLSDLADTDFTNLSAGNFIMFDGLKWKNVYSSATASWGAILGNLIDQTDLKNALDAKADATDLSGKVNTDGTSIMTAPLKFMSGSVRGAVGPYFNGVGFWKLDSQGNLTQIASISDSQFIPTTTNAIDIGNSTKKWKDLYLSGKAYVGTINNGYDISIPAYAGTIVVADFTSVTAGQILALDSNLKPVWQNAPTIPTVGDGTITITQGGETKGTFTTNQSGNTTIDLDAGGGTSNYHPDLFDWKWADSLRNDVQWLRADTFSWQSGDVYEAAYNHLDNEYANAVLNLPVTVATQNAYLGNNKGGWRVVWDGTKFVAISAYGYVSTSLDGMTWEPSTQNANLGNNDWCTIAYDGTKFVALGYDGHISTSTNGADWAVATQNANLGENKWSKILWDGTKFVALGYDGYVSTSEDGTIWAEATQNDNLSQGYGWYGLAYDGTKFVALGSQAHISTSTDCINWSVPVVNTNLGSANLWYGGLTYTGNGFIAVGWNGAVSRSLDGVTWEPAVVDANLGYKNWSTIVYNGVKLLFVGNTAWLSETAFSTETIAGTTIKYCTAADGHKICPASEESNVSVIYNATGVAWYYIIDMTNKRFKLPRGKHNKYAATLGVVGNGITLGLTDGTNNYGLNNVQNTALAMAGDRYGTNAGTTSSGANSTQKTLGITTDPTKSGIIAQQEQDTNQYKYLYFYVGEFTQTALENTAGLNAELFNNKVDLNSSWGAPSSTYDNLTLGATGSAYIAPADGWFCLNKTASGSQFACMQTQYGLQQSAYGTNGMELQISIPITKGDTVYVYYNAGGTTNQFRFVYAKKTN